jgi:hypothetical protein
MEYPTRKLTLLCMAEKSNNNKELKQTLYLRRGTTDVNTKLNKTLKRKKIQST